MVKHEHVKCDEGKVVALTSEDFAHVYVLPIVIGMFWEAQLYLHRLPYFYKIIIWTDPNTNFHNQGIMRLFYHAEGIWRLYRLLCFGNVLD